MKKKPPAKGETPTPKPTKRPTAGGDFSEELFLRDWKNRTPTELWRYANHALQCLRLLAMNGDAEATSVHLKVVVNAVYGLCEEMKRPNLGGLGAAIQSSPTWPAFFPANRKSRELLAKRMADLGLATNYCTDALGNYHAESPATRCVLSIFQMLLDSGKVRDGNAGNLMFFNGVPVGLLPES